jgi:CBS domain-containing protein
MKAKDVMTKAVFCVNINADVRHAVKIMLRERISGIPVINDAHTLVGMITEGDLLRRAETDTERERPRWLEFLTGTGKQAAEYVASHSGRVADVMSRNVAVVDEDAPLKDIVGIMERRKVKRVPVVLNGRVVGIVTRADILKALVAEPCDKQLVSDDTIRCGIEAELAKRPWNAHQGHIVVHDGIVELWGFVFHETERDAMRVAAESVPGVKSVRDHLIWVDPMTGSVVDLALTAMGAPAESGAR